MTITPHIAPAPENSPGISAAPRPTHRKRNTPPPSSPPPPPRPSPDLSLLSHDRGSSSRPDDDPPAHRSRAGEFSRHFRRAAVDLDPLYVADRRALRKAPRQAAVHVEGGITPCR